jgi:hypothetical protein
MANTKKALKNKDHEKSMMEKIGDQATHLKEEIVAGKDHLIELAGDAFTSVKETIQDLTKKKKPVKKTAAKVIKPAVKRAVKAATAVSKKAATPKRVVKKNAKKATAKK